MKCLGEAAHFTTGSKEHLLICELSPCDLKTKRSTWLRPTEAFPCQALLAGALELAAILWLCDSLQDGPYRAPEGKQAAGRVLNLPAPNRRFSAGASPWCDFSSHCLSGQPPQSLSCKHKSWMEEIFIENANWILATLPSDPQGALPGYFKTPQPHSRGASTVASHAFGMDA